MKRRWWHSFLPAPLLSLLLGLSWLSLNESISVGNVLLGATLAILVPLYTRGLHNEGLVVRSWPTVFKLAAVVLRDIVVSNITVARQVLGRESALKPRLVWVPLDIHNRYAIVSLAGIITLTPGTVSSELSDSHSHLLVHALHCPDDAAEADLIAEIKSRYESPLKEIFE